jgi:hypothetical protein
VPVGFWRSFSNYADAYFPLMLVQILYMAKDYSKKIFFLCFKLTIAG